VNLKILVISSNVFPIPLKGYGQLEQLAYLWAVEFQKAGHEVSVVAPEGSTLPEGMELVATKQGEIETDSWNRYKDRLLTGAWDAVMDNSWWWCTIWGQMEHGKQLPVVHCYHSDPTNCDPHRPPPVERPCLVCFSKAQSDIMTRRWRKPTHVVLHGIDTEFYHPDPKVERGDRYLFLARYCPEKGFLDIADMARKCRIGLDAYGDTTIIGPHQAYAANCFHENDGKQIRVNPAIPREQTVKEYQTHKALITWPNFVEIFGATTVEAMCCGCPVISKDSGAARELIVHGKTGFVVDTIEEAEDLIKSDAISALNPQDIIEQGRKFTIERSAAGHLRVLNDVAQGFYW
jgi:glycosyltransferase involved in cell wall biosynthesis